MSIIFAVAVGTGIGMLLEFAFNRMLHIYHHDHRRDHGGVL